jgi:hypothetical protein
MVAASLSVSEARSAIRTYVYQSLRDQMARVTFLIEGEVAEASDLSSTVPTACVGKGPSGGEFRFAFTHKYTKSQSPTSPTVATICYFNIITSGDLYRFGPKFNDQSGILMTSASSLRLVSPRTALDIVELSQGVLKYKIKIESDASGSGSIWNLSYAPSSEQVARVGTACMPSASTTSTGCW